MYGLWAHQDLNLIEPDQNAERISVIDILEDIEIQTGFGPLRPGHMTKEWEEYIIGVVEAYRFPAHLNARILDFETRERALEGLRKLWRQWRKGQRFRGLQRDGFDPKNYRNIAGTAAYKKVRKLWILSRQDRNEAVEEDVAAFKLARLDPEGAAAAAAAASAAAFDPGFNPDFAPAFDHSVPDPPFAPAVPAAPPVGFDPGYPYDPAFMHDPANNELPGIRASRFDYNNDDLVWNAPLLVVVPDPDNPTDCSQHEFHSCNLSEALADDSPLNPDYLKDDFVSFDDMWIDCKGLQILTLVNRLIDLGAMTTEGSVWWSFRPSHQWRMMLMNATDRTPILTENGFREIVRRTYQEFFPWYYGKRNRDRGPTPNGLRPCFTIFVVPNSQEFPIFNLPGAPPAIGPAAGPAQGSGDPHPVDPASPDAFDEFITMPSSGSSRDSGKRFRRGNSSSEENSGKRRNPRRSSRNKK
ncbi:uncharacterized protein N7483_005098 [Penicillium malachiteum]|uniref:uncharacterized protein n=1 Tax=Penicillium malachiteum TaxID=1324776 RepID=UPI0025472907|nr:uncharacterized protein N7483_005098 [Penicillium malachiteum]KAJ5730590.1 hypothetical protein N7483_005098 [Penicillium malachiteum]